VISTHKEVSKNLDECKSVKVILIEYQNNYVERSNWFLECRNFLQHRLNIIYNYFDGPRELFSSKFLDTSVKLFFPRVIFIQISSRV
jgi:hypothetical protein